MMTTHPPIVSDDSFPLPAFQDLTIPERLRIASDLVQGVGHALAGEASRVQVAELMLIADRLLSIRTQVLGRAERGR